MPSLGGRAVLTLLVGVASCSEAPGSSEYGEGKDLCPRSPEARVLPSTLFFVETSCLIWLSGIVRGKVGPWDPSFGWIPSFGTIYIIPAVPDVFTCSFFSSPHVGVPWIPTGWPVLVSLCSRVSERDPMYWLQDDAPHGPPVQVCQQGSQRTNWVFHLPTWLLRCFWASLLRSYSSQVAMTQSSGVVVTWAQRLVTSIPNLQGFCLIYRHHLKERGFGSPPWLILKD